MTDPKEELKEKDDVVSLLNRTNQQQTIPEIVKNEEVKQEDSIEEQNHVQEEIIKESEKEDEEHEDREEDTYNEVQDEGKEKPDEKDSYSFPVALKNFAVGSYVNIKTFFVELFEAFRSWIVALLCSKFIMLTVIAISQTSFIFSEKYSVRENSIGVICLVFSISCIWQEIKPNKHNSIDNKIRNSLTGD